MEVSLHYGSSAITLEIPERNIARIIRPWAGDETAGDAFAIDPDALRDFADAAASRRVCVLTTDGSRDMAIADILPQFSDALFGCAGLRFVIATGTHNRRTAGNRKIVAAISNWAEASGIENVSVHVHDCQEDEFISAGQTNCGTDVEYNSIIAGAEIFLVLSDVKFHYFAGYSNPVKNFVPGVCSYRTAEGNHRLAMEDSSTFGVHPWHNDAKRRGNRLACDQVEAMDMILAGRKVWAFVTISDHGRIQWAKFDEIKAAAAAAFDVADERNAASVRPEKYLIVSPGPLPNDVDLYISQRALELTKNAVKDGGEVLFVSACPEGVGPARTLENFYNRLSRPLDEILSGRDAEYRLFTHKPYKFAQLISRLNKVWVYSEISNADIERIHLKPTEKPQDVVDKWLKKDPDAQIIVVDGANKIALYPEQYGTSGIC